MQNYASFCKRPFSTIQIICIFRQICNAVAYLHSQGIVHQDVHPKRVSQIGNTVKLDMIGMPHNFKRLIKNEAHGGHLHYSAPELFDDEQFDTDYAAEKADIWALGCLLYFLASKRDPFEGSSRDEVKKNIRKLYLDSTMRGVAA